MMRFVASLMVVFLVPSMALAGIQSSVSATANSGGNSVGPGGSVTTGDASASANVHTTTSGSSSSSFSIKTDVDGAVHEETYTSSSSQVSVSVQATPKETKVEIREGNPSQTVKQEQEASSAPEAPQNLLQQIVSWFGALLDWF